MDVRNKLHIEGDGEANILSFFCVRFSRKEEGQVLYLFSGVTYYLSRGEGGGVGGERRRFGGSHGFHCCQRVYRRDFELTTKKGEGGGVMGMLQNFMGDQVNFNDTTKILQPSPGDKY